jgi:ABC-type sugar transport system substrate-binding protein
LTPQPKPPIEDILASLGEPTGDGVTVCYVHVGPDALAIGETAADYIAEKLPDGGVRVAMVKGGPASSNALNRGEGFKTGVAKYSNLDLVASQTAN